MILKIKRMLGVAVVMALAAALLGACSEPVDGPNTKIIVTTTVWGDVVERLVDGDLEVEVIYPPGADPHDFRPSASQVANIETAALIIANGLGLEESIEDVLDANGERVLLLAPNLLPLPYSDDHDDDEEHADEGEDHDHGDLDPHVWHDPIRVAAAAELIGAELAKLAPGIDWDARIADFTAEMDELDAFIAAEVAAVPADARKLITNHDSLEYWADRYGFEVIGTVIPAGSPLAQPSARDIAELADLIDTEGIPAIFAETTEPTQLAEAVARESGAEIAVIELFSGSLDENGPFSSYTAAMEENARLIAGALAR